MKATLNRFVIIALVTLYAEFSIIPENSKGLIDINDEAWFL